MNFKQVEKRFKQLEAQFVAGKLSETELKTQLEELMVQDDKGSWWIIGYETKQWHRYNGKEWVQANPHRNWIVVYGAIALFIVIAVLVNWVIAYLLNPPNTSIQPGSAGPPGPTGEPGVVGPAGPAGEMANLTCVECHNNNGIINGKHFAWSESLHGNGETISYAGFRVGCSGCHSGGGFTEMIASGVSPDELDTANLNPSRIDCYVCHQIHSSYTSADWALMTTNSVTVYAFESITYDGGKGNLCAICHQPRRQIEEADANGNIEVTSTHWGPHHGPQSAMLLGIGGGGVEGSPSAHYSMVEDTCVTCHMGESDDHTFLPSVDACQICHADAEYFDINGLQTEVEELLSELKEALISKGIWDSDGDFPVTGNYPAGEAQALWNYIFIANEDSSLGVHNPTYTKALLDWSIKALK